MKTRYLSLIVALTITAAGFIIVAGLRQTPVKAVQAAQPPNDRENALKESPPEDWFITQRVTHNGIPAGALERAGAQAAALADETFRTDALAAGSRWKFVGPTNIGGRVVDI